MATAITPPLLAARHIPAGISATGGAAIIAGSGIATALCAALGIGVGAIIRNQAGAIIAVLALLYVAEPLLGFIPHLGTAIQQYGLGGLAAATTHTAGFPGSAHLLGQPAATLILAGYAAAALLAGAALLRRRDITTGLRFPTPAPPHNRQAEPNPGRRLRPGQVPKRPSAQPDRNAFISVIHAAQNRALRPGLPSPVSQVATIPIRRYVWGYYSLCQNMHVTPCNSSHGGVGVGVRESSRLTSCRYTATATVLGWAYSVSPDPRLLRHRGSGVSAMARTKRPASDKRSPPTGLSIRR